MTPEERERRIAGFKEAQRAPRRAEHQQKIVDALKRHWADGTIKFATRVCRHCDTTFEPHSGSQVYCSYDCRLDHRPLLEHRLSAAEYREIFDAQGGVCALCSKDHYGWGGRHRALVVDHCHKTHRVRGLLCSDCNTALGRFGENPARLRAAAEYLENGAPALR